MFRSLSGMNNRNFLIFARNQGRSIRILGESFPSTVIQTMEKGLQI